MAHDEALKQADRLFLVKRLVKACALQHGYLASFMAKPLMDLPGSGLHVHLSLADGQGANVFALDNGKAPEALRHFIGGLQTYLPKAFALIAPNVNSYRRFVSGSSAPINLEWGYDTVPPDSACPMRTMRAAGSRTGLPAPMPIPTCSSPQPWPAACSASKKASNPGDPAEGDAYDLPADLPIDLRDALRVLSRHKKLRRLLTRRFIHGFVTVKREELQHLGRWITPWEVGYLGSML